MALAAKIFLAVISICLIVVILMQSSKSAGLSGSIGGGAEQLFGKAKARGIDALLQRLTTIFAILFIVTTLLVGYFIK
ncbi:preprotein translocase subunit SecG [Thermoflavimicrobium daqui]|uniref:Protein-export membrane protein SecG n=1 Tax=Thermoflavimicrobium daqui TaxID=2137476 RepID=A0A364K550_9BACL|nr:preprotein translocase subunit SecG [Thermoflavimicrobium daqui]RAL24476.1 preprotein translocase subunit SecG [Thermoflavimicrobium daqui]